MWSKMNGFWEEGPKGKYHRRRYQVYTDKVKVARAVENQRHILIQDPVKDNDDSITEPPPAKHILRSQVDAFDINKCAICQQDKTKLMKEQRGKVKRTVKFKQDSHWVSEIRDDRCLLLQLQGKDTIAIGINYHNSSCVQYVRPGALAKLEEKNCEDEDLASES